MTNQTANLAADTGLPNAEYLAFLARAQVEAFEHLETITSQGDRREALLKQEFVCGLKDMALVLGATPASVGVSIHLGVIPKFKVGNVVVARTEDLLRVRERKCCFPGCDNPVGITSGKGLCMRHHRSEILRYLTPEETADYKVLRKKGFSSVEALQVLGREELAEEHQARMKASKNARPRLSEKALRMVARAARQVSESGDGGGFKTGYRRVAEIA